MFLALRIVASLPYLPLWTDAYLSDTRGLSTVEHGAYLLLMMCAWRAADCCLPADDAVLARLAGLTKAQWRKVKPAVMALWEMGEDGNWRQKRLTKEHKKSTEMLRKRKESGSLGGRAKSLKNKKTPVACAKGSPQASPKRSSAIQTQTHTNTSRYGVAVVEHPRETKFEPDQPQPQPRNHAIHPDWRPMESTIEALSKEGIPPHFSTDQLRMYKFIAHYREAKQRLSAWEAKFISWVIDDWRRKSDEEKPHDSAGRKTSKARSAAQRLGF